MKKFKVKFRTTITKIGYIKIYAWKKPSVKKYYVRVFNNETKKYITSSFDTIAHLKKLNIGYVLLATSEELNLIRTIVKMYVNDLGPNGLKTFKELSMALNNPHERKHEKRRIKDENI